MHHSSTSRMPSTIVLAAAVLLLPGCGRLFGQPEVLLGGLPTATWWPAPGASLPANGRLVATLAIGGQDPDAVLRHVASLADGGLVLRPEHGADVPLVRQSMVEPSSTRAQVVLVPKTPLDTAGVTYRLAPRTAPAPNSTAADGWRTLSAWGHSSPLTWHATGTPLTQAPTWRRAPHIADTNRCGALRRLIHLCPAPSSWYVRVLVQAPIAGPAKDVHLAVDVRGKGLTPEPWLLPLGTGGPGWTLGPHEAELSDRGFPGSAFPFAPGAAYTVRLAAVDLAGHRVPAPGAPLRFKGFKNPTD